MPLFAYKARGRDGLLIEAQMDAASRDAVATQLLETGVTPIRILPARAAGEAGAAALALHLPWPRTHVGTEDLIVFCRHMYRLSKAGIPIIRAITGLAESTRNPALAAVLGNVADALRSGQQLSDSLKQQRGVFSTLFVSVIHVGESTGRLDDAFEQMGHYLELDRETRKRVKAAMRYPTLVLIAIVGALVLINLFVIPAFARTFEGLGAELPWATRLLMATSTLTLHYWPHATCLLLALVLATRWFVRTPAGRYRWHALKLRIPIVGSIVERATLARFARSFAVTSAAGVPVLGTLEMVARAVDNDYVAKRVIRMRESIERGETMTRAAAACGLFDPLMLQMMAVGEETGTVPDMFREIAESYESEVDYDLKRLSDTIEPVMIVCIGGIVLILALGVYLPMWDMASAARG